MFHLCSCDESKLANIIIYDKNKTRISEGYYAQLKIFQLKKL